MAIMPQDLNCAALAQKFMTELNMTQEQSMRAKDAVVKFMDAIVGTKAATLGAKRQVEEAKDIPEEWKQTLFLEGDPEVREFHGCVTTRETSLPFRKNPESDGPICGGLEFGCTFREKNSRYCF